MEDCLFNIVLGFFLIILGYAFLRPPKDNVNVRIYRWLNDERNVKFANQIVFLINLMMGCVLITNAILCVMFSFPNFGAIPFFLGFVGSWPIKIIALFLVRNKNYEELPTLWPLHK